MGESSAVHSFDLIVLLENGKHRVEIVKIETGRNRDEWDFPLHCPFVDGPGTD